MPEAPGMFNSLAILARSVMFLSFSSAREMLMAFAARASCSSFFFMCVGFPIGLRAGGKAVPANLSRLLKLGIYRDFPKPLARAMPATQIWKDQRVSIG